MNLKTFIPFLFFLFLVNTLTAQETPETRKYDFPRRNSIYLQNHLIFPTLYYDRVFPLGDHFGIIPKIGIEFGLGYGNSLTLEASVFFGGNKHYGEIGIGNWLGAAVIPLNYRYIGKKGLMIKAGYAFAPGEIESAAFVGIGFSF
jgi:hypothetical protein